MNRESFYAEMDGGKKLDYEIYLNTADLYACQKLNSKMRFEFSRC
ncbi:MAG TPA: hypothetical protein VGN99_06050 [Steroidobacteraceae bacterium]|nr:hypothetical protein [Steroidobacteraceae bacterium]